MKGETFRDFLKRRAHAGANLKTAEVARSVLANPQFSKRVTRDDFRNAPMVGATTTEAEWFAWNVLLNDYDRGE